MKKRICFLLCIMLLALCTALAEETAYDLPLDIDFPNYPPIRRASPRTPITMRAWMSAWKAARSTACSIMWPIFG